PTSGNRADGTRCGKRVRPPPVMSGAANRNAGTTRRVSSIMEPIIPRHLLDEPQLRVEPAPRRPDSGPALAAWIDELRERLTRGEFADHPPIQLLPWLEV